MAAGEMQVLLIDEFDVDLRAKTKLVNSFSRNYNLGGRKIVLCVKNFHRYNIS